MHSSEFADIEKNRLSAFVHFTGSEQDRLSLRDPNSIRGDFLRLILKENSPIAEFFRRLSPAQVDWLYVHVLNAQGIFFSSLSRIPAAEIPALLECFQSYLSSMESSIGRPDHEFTSAMLQRVADESKRVRDQVQYCWGLVS